MQKNTLSSQVHMEHSPGHRLPCLRSYKSSLGKFKKIEIISSIFSDPNTLTPNRYLFQEKNKKTVRNTNTRRLNNTFLNNQQVTEEIKREIKKNSRNKWQWKHDNSKIMGWSKRSCKREVYGNASLPQETRKTLNRPPNFTPKTTEKEEEQQQQNTRISQRNENIKLRAEIIEREMKETIVNINKTKSFFFRR